MKEKGYNTPEDISDGRELPKSSAINDNEKSDKSRINVTLNIVKIRKKPSEILVE